LTPNEKELQTITGGLECKYIENARSLVNKGIANVIVTLGEKGVIHVTSDKVRSYPSIKVTAVDTTGAGDCFNGYFASGLAKGISTEEAIRIAVVASGLSVTKHGAQESIPSIEQVMEYINK
jgi:ribokinase